ncbi:aldose 1-epimerase family protein [Microbacterium sediminicola]|uniref:Aldose 1-epimerase family protein n=1 Tax=Microbacterium sediminicola TaxID=415210 RepID=A0ABP4U7Z6_9MICO
MSERAASGIQHELVAGGYRAVVASVGATLRSLSFEGRDLILPFDADEVRPGFRGATLAPWPNRVVDGRYVFAGEEHQLSLTEPERRHALHGLAGWQHWGAVSADAAHVTLRFVIEPQEGYPWRVALDTEYRLGAGGLTQRLRAMNMSASVVPFGTGPHPYLVAPGALEDWVLHLPASRVLLTTDDRLVPTSLESVEVDAARFDFRAPRTVGDTQLDHAYTGLLVGADSQATATVTDATGVGAGLRWGAECPWVQAYTGDVPGGAANPLNRIGLAIEPMTCAPDAFNDAAYDWDPGLLSLESGGSVEASWTLFALS